MTPAEHIERICYREGIVVVNHSRGGRAWRKLRRIAIRPGKSDVTYAVALHEIEHILGDYQNLSRIDKECGAWLWAVDNAMYWTPRMHERMRQSLRGYVAWTRRHKRAFEPGPDHLVFVMLGRNYSRSADGVELINEHNA